MNARLISPWKRANSSQYWFRLVIPPRYRQTIHKTEVRQSLGTDDLGKARRLCAIRQADWLRRFELIELELSAQEAQEGVEAVDRHLDRKAAELGGMDRAVAFELEGMALAEAGFLDVPTREDFGLAAGKGHPLSADAWPVPVTADVQRMIAMRRATLTGTCATVLPGREAIDRPIGHDVLRLTESTIEEAFLAAGLEVDPADPRFAAAARHLFDRLGQHPLPGLDRVREAFPTPPPLQPVRTASPEPIEAATSTKPASATPAQQHDTAIVSDDGRQALRHRILSSAATVRTLSEVYEDWASNQPAKAAKLCDEWRVAVRRFVELFGDLGVDEIDSDMIMDFREAMKRLPTRPAKHVAAMPILDQIDHARAEGLPLLAGATVGKLVSGLRVTLGHACDPLRIIKVNPAVAVKVTGTKSAADARLPFSPEDLHTIFSHPMMTDPRHGTSLTSFWFLVLAPLTGLRIEEIGKLRPQNVRCERGIWYAAIERDRKRDREAEAREGKASKDGKTDAAFRDVPLHWLLIEAGFIDYVAYRQAAGEEWLFSDLEADKYGSRSKSLSRDLIRHFRAIGIDEDEKVFHSFRHSMKRACRETSMKEEIADLLAGHAPPNVGRKYGAGAALNVLRDAVNLIDYESIDWDPVVQAAKQRVAGTIGRSAA